MKNPLARLIPFMLLAAFASAVVTAQTTSGEPEYHYAYRHVGADGQETSMMNWEGTLNWDSHAKQDELWVQKDGKTYLITDKATLDAFQKATQPLRDVKALKGGAKELYYSARNQQRDVERQNRSLARQIESLQRRKGRNDADRADYDRQIKDLQSQQWALDKQIQEADKQVEAATQKRADYDKRREEVRAKVYAQTDKLINQAMKKGLGKPAQPR